MIPIVAVKNKINALGPRQIVALISILKVSNTKLAGRKKSLATGHSCESAEKIDPKLFNSERIR